MTTLVIGNFISWLIHLRVCGGVDIFVNTICDIQIRMDNVSPVSGAIW